MRRSKLEVHLDVLKALTRYGPLKLTHIMYKTEVNCKDVKPCLEFLIKQNLVEEATVGKRSIYRVTERGIAVLENLRKLENALKVPCVTAL